MVIVAAILLTCRGTIYGRMVPMIFIGAIWNSQRRIILTGYACLILISMIREVSNLLVDVKKMKMEAQAKQKEKREQKQRRRKRRGNLKLEFAQGGLIADYTGRYWTMAVG